MSSSLTNSAQKPVKKIGLNTLISWGASVVIIGLMFKLLHWQGGEWMIGIGLGVEACLFFILGIAAYNDREEAKTEVVTVAAGENDLDRLLKTTINPKTIEKLGQGFDQFNKTVESVNQIAGHAQLTKGMMDEVQVATKEIQELRKNLAELNTVYRAQLEAFRKH